MMKRDASGSRLEFFFLVFFLLHLFFSASSYWYKLIPGHLKAFICFVFKWPTTQNFSAKYMCDSHTIWVFFRSRLAQFSWNTSISVCSHTHIVKLVRIVSAGNGEEIMEWQTVSSNSIVENRRRERVRLSLGFVFPLRVLATSIHTSNITDFIYNVLRTHQKMEKKT